MSLDAAALAADLQRGAAGARAWLDGPHAVPIGAARQAEIAAALDDVAARARQWAAEPALLVVAFLGGTGVGKSTLLNALSGAAIADAGLMRPTTQHATVYHHEDVPASRLDPRLRACRAVPHRRAELRDKVLVDTPDIDGNVPEHHERLKALLPAADAVLYVGSQEKYHDRLAWELLHAHRHARAFAFVLNKWDRCQPGPGDRAGKMPDEDFRASLVAAGFAKPKLFRTAAGQWALRRLHGQEPDEPLADDFPALEQWLDAGLSARMVQGIKANGLAGRTTELAALLDAAAPADWADRVAALRTAWDGAAREAARLQAQALAEAGDRHSRAFDQHFRSYERRDFDGLFGIYLGLVGVLQRLRQGVQPGRMATAAADAAVEALGDATRSATPLDDWARRCVADTPAETRTARAEDLRRRLLALADRQGVPIAAAEACLPAFAAEPGAAYEALRAEAAAVERTLATADGARARVRHGFAWVAHWLPWAAGGLVILKWLWDVAFAGAALITLTPVFFALLAMFAALAGLHFALVKLRPTQWKQLRRRLADGVEERLFDGLAPTPRAAADRLAELSRAERAALEAPRQLLHGVIRKLDAAALAGGELFAGA